MQKRKSVRKWAGGLMRFRTGKTPEPAAKKDEEFLRSLSIEPGSLIIDCGASVGNTVDVFLSKGAVVHAFEAEPQAVCRLKERFSGNRGLHIHNLAVSDQDGVASFYLHRELDHRTLERANGSSLIEFKRNVDKSRAMSVETVDLSRFLSELDQPVALIKIDIEGSEIEVVNRLLDTGTHALAGLILVETHERKIPELAWPTEELRSRIRRQRVRNICLDWH